MDLDKARQSLHGDLSKRVAAYEEEIVNLRDALKNSEQKRTSLYESFTQQNESLARYEKQYGTLAALNIPPAAPAAPAPMAPPWNGQAPAMPGAPPVLQPPVAPSARTQEWRYNPSRMTATEMDAMKARTSQELHQVFTFDVAEFVFAVLFNK